MTTDQYLDEINREIYFLERKENQVKQKKDFFNKLKSDYLTLQKKYLDLKIVNNYLIANLDNNKEKNILYKTAYNMHEGEIKIFSFFKVKDKETQSFIYSRCPSIKSLYYNADQDNLIFSSHYIDPNYYINIRSKIATNKDIKVEIYDYESLANKSKNPKKEIKKIQEMFLKNIRHLKPKQVTTNSTSILVNNFVNNLIFI